MKATKWQRAVSLLLCLLMAMSFLTVTAPKAYAADDTTAAEVSWPQLTKLTIGEYVYDAGRADRSSVACKVESINYKHFPTLVVKNDRNYAGEVQITVKKPVTVENGVPTATPATTTPTPLWVPKANVTGEVSAGGRLNNNNLKADRTADNSNVYTNETYSTIVKITYNANDVVYYSIRITIEAGSSGDTNTAPALKAGVASSAAATTTVDTAWTLNLADIFVDADNDPLTYKVKVNDAEPVDADVNYSYTPKTAGETTLVFTANDGKADSPTYTVTLTATAAEVTYAITATVDGEYIVNVENTTRPMGETEITVNGTPASEAKAGDHIVVKATPQKCNLFNTDLYDAKFDHWEVVAGPTGFLSNDALKNAKLTFNMPAAAVSLKAVFVTVGSQVTLTANNFAAGDVSLMIGDWATVASTYDSTSGKHMNDSVTRTVIAGAKVSAVITTGTKNAGYKLTGWKITNTTKNEPVDVAYDAGRGGIERPYFTVDGTSSYTIKAIFAAKDYGNVNVTVNDESMGTATAQIDTEEAATSLIGVVEGTEVKLQAQPKTGYVFQSWSATYGSDNTQVAIANSTAAQTTFVMPETNHQPVNVVAEFAVDPSYLSEACALTDVTLLDNNDSSISYAGNQDGTDFTIEVPADTDDTKLAGMILKLKYSENAQVFKDKSDTPWDANGQACNMTLGTTTKFVVRSQKDLAEGYEGPKQEYTITINRAKSTECAIESAALGEVKGTVDQTKKTVTFTVPADTDESAVADMLLTFNCSQYASIKLKDAEENWPTAGKACNMALNEVKTFVVTAEDGTTTAVYTVVIHRAPSDKKALTGATLGDIAAVINEDSHAVTFTVPADTTDSKLGEMILKLTVSDYATVKKSGDTGNWPAEGKACGMELNKATTFTVTAENGDAQDYTVTVNREKSTENAITEAVLTKTDGTSVNADISEQNKTVTFTLPVGTTDADVAAMTLKFTCSQYASIKLDGETSDWPTDGQLCDMVLNEAKTFVVTAENDHMQPYTVLIVRSKSSANEITNAFLLAKAGDTTSLATVKIDNAKKTIDFTLPAGSDTSKLGEMILKLTVSDYATVKKSGDTGNWPAAGKACGMELNKAATFTVTAENGDAQDYTVTTKYTAPNAPTLSNGSATRTSKTGATVKFTSSEAGNYFYKVVDHGATAPTADEIMKSTTKGTASTGEITFTLSNLTEDARDIYIVVVNASGGKSAALKVEIPAYGSGTDTPDTGAYKISIRAPKGGTITTNRTKADASDEIIVTVTPDNGYQMVSGSLTYTLEKAGGETKTISNGRFTMPAGDVSITCKWETATTTAKGITSFSINGVAGAVNNTTNTITITLPRGTDVTKLTPVIATNGVKSLTPGNGETVNFTNAVTYTAAMEDGSSKTYTVTVYVDKGTLADQFWDKLTDFATQVPWWQYAEKQQSTSKYPKYW